MDEETIDSELFLNEKEIEGLLKQLREKQQIKAKLIRKKDEMNEKIQFKTVLSRMEEDNALPKMQMSPGSESESINPEVTKPRAETKKPTEISDDHVLTIPLVISSIDVKMQQRSCKPGPRSKLRLNHWIANALGNKNNSNLNRVCLEVASKYFVEQSKSKSKRCVITAIVPARTYNFQKLYQTGAGTAFYYEHSFYDGHYLFILKSTQHTNDSELEDTQLIYQGLKTQSVACAQYPTLDSETCTIF